MRALERLQRSGVHTITVGDTDEVDIDWPDYSPTLSVGAITKRDAVTEQGMQDLITKALESGMPLEYKTDLEQIIFRFENIWRITQGFDAPADVEPMVITLQPEARPRRCALRRYNELERKFMHDHLQMLVKAGLVYKIITAHGHQQRCQ
jgi:hypothetical protein